MFWPCVLRRLSCSWWRSRCPQRRRILDKRDLDALAIVCRAANFDARLFLLFAVQIQEKNVNAIGKAREYNGLYAAITHESAMRTIQF